MEERYGRSNWIGKKYNSLVLLIAMLAISFCIFTFIYLAIRFSYEDSMAARATFESKVLTWFVLPNSFPELLTRPWTLITYMFMHTAVFHLIGNLIWLWIFGFILQDLTGQKSIIPLFIYGAICGGLFYLVTVNTIPGFLAGKGDYMLGASAGIMAIAVAATMVAPGYRLFTMLFGGIPLWVITVIFIVIDFSNIANDINTGGHLSHLGGALFGIAYTVFWRRGIDLANGMNRFFSWINDLFNPRSKHIERKARQEYFYNTGNAKPFKKTPNLTQKRIDAILDKIGERGYQSLSEEEKQILKRAAEDENL